MLTITKWPISESRQLACMAIGKWNRDPVRSEIWKTDQRIRGKARFRLFAVCDDGRISFFESCDSIAQSYVFRRKEAVFGKIPRCVGKHRLQQSWRARDASDRFGRNRHSFDLSTSCAGKN